MCKRLRKKKRRRLALVRHAAPSGILISGRFQGEIRTLCYLKHGKIWMAYEMRHQVTYYTYTFLTFTQTSTHMHMLACIPTHIHTHMDICIHAYRHTYTHTHTHKYIPTCVRTYVYIHTHQKHIHTCMHAWMHIRTPTCMQRQTQIMLTSKQKQEAELLLSCRVVTSWRKR